MTHCAHGVELAAACAQCAAEVAPKIPKPRRLRPQSKANAAGWHPKPTLKQVSAALQAARSDRDLAKSLKCSLSYLDRIVGYYLPQLIPRAAQWLTAGAEQAKQAVDASKLGHHVDAATWLGQATRTAYGISLIGRVAARSRAALTQAEKLG